MQGYWNNPEETRGSLRTVGSTRGTSPFGTRMIICFIVDRKKDMIIAGGFNIYPREIDEVLFQHPKIREAVCVGLADEYRGETVKAYVVLEEGRPLPPKRSSVSARKSWPLTRCPSRWNSGRPCPSRRWGRSCGRYCGRGRSEEQNSEIEPGLSFRFKLGGAITRPR